MTRDFSSETARAVHKSLDMVTIILVLAGLVVAWPYIERAQSSRWWRDLTGQTPFSDVEFQIVRATAQEVWVSGLLTKHRADCETVGPPIVALEKSGVGFFGRFETRETKDTPSSRPAMDVPQEFGPWVIQSPLPMPDHATLLRRHRCGAAYQTNTVLEFDWPAPMEGEQNHGND